jgi:hypothetical protein
MIDTAMTARTARPLRFGQAVTGEVALVAAPVRSAAPVRHHQSLNRYMARGRVHTKVADLLDRTINDK